MIFSTILLILVHMMAGPIATCSGSSRGAEPPPGPYRLPSQCESAHDANNPRKKQRKGRGKVKGHGIADWVIRNGKITLTFDEEGDTWKAIGNMAAWWDSAVGIHTRDCCEPFHDNWKDVPHLQRAQVRDRLLDWFDIDFEAQDGVFLDVVDKDANICYNNWKNKLNKHFKKSKTVEAAKANRPDSVRDDAQWDRCCERFASEDFKGKSKKGSENRAKHKYKSYHGRRSYMQHRALKDMDRNSRLKVPRVSKKNPDKSRRTWSSSEEKQLVCALKDLVAKGFKCDNGFKSGYLSLCEKWLQGAFPGTDLKADPHINSKVHVWKKQYVIMFRMFGNSGAGLNPTTHEIDCEEAIWEQAITDDNYARSLKNKSFPYYNDWLEIFGKDRATGESSVAFADVVQDFLNTNGAPSTYCGSDDPYTESHGESLPLNPGDGSFTTTSSGKGKKRKSDDGFDDVFISAMSSFCEKTDTRMGEIAERMGELAQRIGTEFDATKKRENVYETLGRMSFLLLEDKVHVSQMLCNNPKELDLFFSMPEEGKEVMVRSILAKIGGGGGYN